jgi:LuxR family maltose regulon positive regulatory protein
VRGDVDAAMRHAELLLEHGRPSPGEVGTDDLRALALTHRGIAELWSGELDRGRRDLECARGAARAGGRDWMVVLCAAYLGIDAMICGRYERATRLCAEAEQLAHRRGWHTTWPMGMTAATLSVIAYHRDRLDEAERRYARAVDRTRRSTDRPLRALIALQRARLCSARSLHEQGLEALQEAREWLRDWPIMPAIRGLIDALEATATAALGDPSEAAERLASDDGRTREMAVALARLRLRDGDPDGALAVLDPFLQGAGDPFGSSRIEAWVLAALARDALAEHGAAAASLERALAAAEAGGLRRPFLADGPAIAPLLRRHIRAGTSHRALAGDLLATVERPAATRTAAVLPDTLSEREAAVLRFLPTMMSNQEIASELFVSVNTVKTHLKAIYRKLDVDDRRAAVRRARELSLVGPR